MQPRVPGVSPTRYSLFLISLGTPISMVFNAPIKMWKQALPKPAGGSSIGGPDHVSEDADQLVDLRLVDDERR